MDISLDEVFQAVNALNLHKTAGADGVKQRFFIDTQAIIVPAMVTIGNELLHGSRPPQAFLKGLIIPLRKRGDSADAMDYRPIALLQTGYKIFAKVIATRVQGFLGTTIGVSQQGFIHGRQMLKAVMMMMAVLDTARHEPAVDMMQSKAILLLDFRKAYDTVARDFLFVALQKFGFSPAFVTMIQNIHAGTTAQFVVNGELSEPQEVVSGIRQGCPLAPLLFIIAAEVLALAIEADATVVRITVPGSGAVTHKFSACVDDSTVLLQEARQLPRVLLLVERFGRLAGLKVQPSKRKLIFLNLAVSMDTFFGIPVLPHSDTTRCLGYAVNTGELTDVNWAARIRNVQRRLANATRLATSVEHRVLILNVIMLPSVLFTAEVFVLQKWADQQLQGLQKQFLWLHSTSIEASRHKINPALLHTPKQARGVGLASILIACKSQRVKHAILWLTQRKDLYFSIWQAWLLRGTPPTATVGISPLVGRSHQSVPGYRPSTWSLLEC